ncbi:MAG: ribbon-helix-helix domain-containing protein [Candidatus Micrarchaeota archaeon]
MSNVTLYLPDDVKKELDSYSEVRWSEFIRQAIITKLKELRKLDLLKKYVEKEPFTQADLDWMDQNDWHPVDENQMKLTFVNDINKRNKGRIAKAKNIDQLFK